MPTWVIAFAKLSDAVLTHFALLALAITLFASTNVDDLVVLVGFFADPKFRPRDVVAGQYAGLAFLFGVSAAGALLSLVIPNAYLGLLGILPILIGIRKLVALRHERVQTNQATSVHRTPSSYGNIAGVALVTIANGGDNVGVYMPSFAVHSGSQIVAIAVVFAAMTALWCMLAHRMVSHPRFGAPFRRYTHIFAPLVLIGLGVLIIHNAGTIVWLIHRR
jgi:cadmium resistance protein CadD (predicted permease)